MEKTNVKVLNLILLLTLTEAFTPYKDDKCCAAVPSGVFILAITFAVIINKESHLFFSQRHCEPFNGYFVWDQCENYDDFTLQRHYIAKVMDNATRGTNITLKTGNQLVTFMKNNSRSGSKSVTSVKIDSSHNDVMSYISLKEDISKEKYKTKALLLFFFVNENSRIDKEETAIKELKKNKVFVVYHGPESIPYFWKSLATDDRHILHLKHDKEEDFLFFLNLICHDSRLYCNTDMFWKGTECFRCSFICTQMPSEYCNQECPYFEFTSSCFKNSNGEANNTLIIVGFVITNIITPLAVICILKWDDIRTKCVCIFKKVNQSDCEQSIPLREEKMSTGTVKQLKKSGM